MSALFLVLVGCSGGQDEDESAADGAADRLAAALEAGDFADVELSGSTTKEVRKDYAATVEGMSGRADREGGEGRGRGGRRRAAAALAWWWPVGEQEWSYATEAALKGWATSGR